MTPATRKLLKELSARSLARQAVDREIALACLSRGWVERYSVSPGRIAWRITPDGVAALKRDAENERIRSISKLDLIRIAGGGGSTAVERAAARLYLARRDG